MRPLLSWASALAFVTYSVCAFWSVVLTPVPQWWFGGTIRATEPSAIHGTLHPIQPIARAVKPAPIPMREIIRRAGVICGVPQAVLARLIMAESSGRHYGPDGRVLVSIHGARGAAQIKPSTAAEFDPRADIDDPIQNVTVGACLLRQHFDRCGGWECAAHDYSAGRFRSETSAETLAFGRKVAGR